MYHLFNPNFNVKSVKLGAVRSIKHVPRQLPGQEAKLLYSKPIRNVGKGLPKQRKAYNVVGNTTGTECQD